MNQYRKDRKDFNKDVGLYHSEDEDEEPKKPRRFGGKTLEQRKAEDPMDLSSTRRRLLMPDPNDPLDPNNIEKMLEARMKSRKSESADFTDEEDRRSTSSRASNTGEDWLAMAARAAQMSKELSLLDAEPVDHVKFDKVYNDVLEKKKSISPPSEEDDDFEEEETNKVQMRRQLSKESLKSSDSAEKPKFRSRFLDKVRGTIDPKTKDLTQR